MFYISKLLWVLAQPSMVLVVLVVAAALLSGTRYRRTARGLLIGAAVLVVAAGILPLGNWLMLPLEERFPRADLSGRPIDGIVILGGAEDARVALARHVHALNMAAERVTEGIALARRFPHAKVVFTGGSSNIVLGPAVEADATQQIFADLGLEPGRLLLEHQARDTSENAAYAKKVADPKPGERWLLVTSAWHMPRAVGLFRAAGFTVEAWPVDYRTAGIEDAWIPFHAPSDGLRRLDIAAREWAGLIFNRISGRSNDLLPGP